jgi:O-methyltransferase
MLGMMLPPKGAELFLATEMTMVAYNLRHLTQNSDQAVSGPIQDDEALFLYSLIRVMQMKRILEIGGLGGYSATNFVAAAGPDGVVHGGSPQGSKRRAEPCNHTERCEAP